MIKLCFGVKGCECDEEVECTVRTVRSPYYGHVLQQQICGHLGAGLDSEKSFIIDPTMRFETIKEVEKAVQRESQGGVQALLQEPIQAYKKYGHPRFKIIGLWMG